MAGDFLSWGGHEWSGAANWDEHAKYSTLGRVRARAELRGRRIFGAMRNLFAADLILFFSFFFDALKLFARLEADGFARRNIHLFARSVDCGPMPVFGLDAEERRSGGVSMRSGRGPWPASRIRKQVSTACSPWCG